VPLECVKQKKGRREITIARNPPLGVATQIAECKGPQNRQRLFVSRGATSKKEGLTKNEKIESDLR